MATILDNALQKALTTLARCKSFMEIASDSKDTVLTMLINQATGFIEAYCKRSFLTQVYTHEIYDGTGGPTMVLRNFPVTAFTTLEVNAGTVGSPSWQAIDSTLYGWYEDGRITLGSPDASFLSAPGGDFICAPQKYRVTYTAGYKIDFNNENDVTKHTLPQELEYACLKLVSALSNNRKGEGLTSAKVGDIAMSFSKGVMGDPEVKEILGKYAAATI